MTTITIDRATVEQALEALEHVVRQAQENLVPTIHYGPVHDVMNNLRAALAQQAEPVQEPVDVGLLEYRGNSVAFIYQKMTAYRTGIDAAWDAFRANGLHPDGKTSLADMIAKHTAPPQQAEPVASLNAWAADRLARHGIQACLYPNCVGGQSGTVCHKHCPTPCPDCRGVGYDASGQLCACQQNPSF